MGTERSDALHFSWSEKSEKFDYYVLSITGALCAYISQTIEASPLGLNAGTFELASLLILFISAFSGFKRIESHLSAHKINIAYLRELETRGVYTAHVGGGAVLNKQTGDVYSQDELTEIIENAKVNIPKYRNLLDKVIEKSAIWYRARNVSLLVGFFVLIFAKLVGVYAAA